MGLIKRNQLEEKGTLMIEKAPVIIKKRPALQPMAPVNDLLLDPNEEDITKVKSQAQEIIDNARKEVQRIEAEAREKGYGEGTMEVSEKIKEALATLNDAVKERKKIIKDAEAEILRLSLKVAEQIIRSEVSLHRDVCLNIVAEAIGRVSDREQIIVRVNRDDAEFLKRYKDRLAGMLDGVKSLSIIEDSNIEPGGCIIETNLGFIDARISTKIKAIEEALEKTSEEGQ